MHEFEQVILFETWFCHKITYKHDKYVVRDK